MAYRADVSRRPTTYGGTSYCIQARRRKWYDRKTPFLDAPGPTDVRVVVAGFDNESLVQFDVWAAAQCWLKIGEGEYLRLRS